MTTNVTTQTNLQTAENGFDSADGAYKLTATRHYDLAKTALDSTADYSYLDIPRTAEGKYRVAVGRQAAAVWLEAQRARELAFLTYVNTQRGLAKTIADGMSTTAGYTVSLPDPDTVGVGLTDSAAGSLSAMRTAQRSRSLATTGSGYNMPAARTDTAGATEDDDTDAYVKYPTVTADADNWRWDTEWEITTASMVAWNTANDTPGATHAWWTKAAALTLALDTWYADDVTYDLDPDAEPAAEPVEFSDLLAADASEVVGSGM